MKPLLTALIILVLIHVLLLGAGAGYLAATDRLSGQRVAQAIDLFKPTLAQDAAAREEMEALVTLEAAKQGEALRLARVAQGPVTIEEQLLRGRQLNAVLAQQSQRLRREQADINRQIESAKVVIEKERSEIEALDRKFRQDVQDYVDQREDDDFKQAVKMIEQLPPKQAKAVFQSLISGGQAEQAVAYLAQMTPRKAGAVLREFKSEEEIPLARDLIEALRLQGVQVAEPTLARVQ